MRTFIFANNASSTLAGSISNVATAAALAPGTGALFPNPSAAQQFALTFVDTATGLVREIVYVTARSGDNLTIVRGQEGTSAVAWDAGSIAAALVTDGTLEAMQQAPGVLTAGGGFWQDVGTANTIEIDLGTLAPAAYADIDGTPLRVRIAANGTGPATFSITGLGSLDVKNPDLTDLVAAQLLQDGIFTLAYDSATGTIMLLTQAGVNRGSQILTVGSGNFTVPDGVYALDTVELWAAGGGGGASNSGVGPGSGGGGGEYACLFDYAVTPGASIAYVVGAAAAAATAGANGGAGANTTWASGAVVTVGGTGGTGSGAGAQVGGAGGTGGTVPAGSLLIDGGSGNACSPTVGAVGGDGGQAARGGPGGNTSTGTPGPGKTPGGGGGGGGGAVTSNGGVGAAGKIVIRWKKG